MTRYIQDAEGNRYTPDQYRAKHRHVHFVGWPSADYLASVGASLVDAIEPATTQDVNAERDRRIVAGFTFQGVHYQSRPEDRENIAGASTSALGAMMNNAAPGDYRWHGEPSDFVWIASDNTEHPMDAQTMFSFGQAAMAHKQAHIFAARALKDADPIPSDFALDSYWPTG